MNRCRLTILVLILLVGPTLADAPSTKSSPRRDTVVVTATLNPEQLDMVNREVIVIDGDRLRDLPITTIDDLLAFLPPIDIQPRVAGGLQGDIHLRGANFAGVLICIDGIRWSDPQTAHFNLEIPVPLPMIDRIEVLTGAQSIYFGSDAVGGVVNIITRKSMPRQIRAEISQGSFDTRDGSLFGVLGQGRVQERLYAGTARSDGFRPDRDYRIRQLFSSTGLTHGQGDTQFIYSFLDNRFGADQFYGPYPSLEETRGHGVMVENRLYRGAFAHIPTRISLSFRQHDDDFILFRDNPSVYRNRHRTRVFLLRAVSSVWQDSATALSLGTEMSHSSITSERLGNHDDSRLALAAELQHRLTSRLHLLGSLRLEHYASHGTRWLPGCGVSCFVTSDVKLRGSYSRAFRVPSFTELYYWSPGNEGNPHLQPERSDSLEGGADWYAAPGTMLSLTVYRRWDRGMIDWVRYAPTAAWQAVNIGHVDVTGASLLLDWRHGDVLHCQGGYSFNNLDPGVVSFESKYALEYARHHVSLLIDARLPGSLRCHLAAHYKRRASFRENYAPVSVRLSRRWRELEIYLQGDNLLNQSYEEIRDVPMPGRSFRVGLRFTRKFE